MEIFAEVSSEGDAAIQKVKLFVTGKNAYFFLPSYCKADSIALYYDEHQYALAVEERIIPSGTMISVDSAAAYAMTLTKEDGTKAEYELSVMQSENLPSIFITTANHSMDYINDMKGNYEPGHLVCVNDSGGTDCDAALEKVKLHGFTSLSVPKKTYQVDFSKDFFNKPTNLTVSGQLNGETYAMAFKNIYTFGPTFRAENSNTTRHAAEFWMIEPEIAFADLKDDMMLAEGMLKYIIHYVLENAPEEMAFFNQFVDKGLIDRLQHVANSEFGHITYTDAITELEKHNDEFEYKVSWGCDLQTEHERYLTEKLFGRPVFVTDYPKEIKAYYMKLNEDGKTVAAMDCLVPGIGEIIGGSQREDKLDILEKRMQECHLNPSDYDFYLDLRRYGSARHAGFGLGFERCVMYLTGMGNIRDVLPFPRTPKTAEF